MKNLEKSKPDFMKNSLNEKEHFEKLKSEAFMKWENWRKLRKCEQTNSPGTNLEKVTLQYRSSLHKYKSYMKRKTFLNDSKEYQDLESICSGKLSHVPSQPAVVPSPRAMSSRDQSLGPDTWNMSGTQGNVFFGNQRAVVDSSQTPYQGILHSWNQSATGVNPVQNNTGRPVAKSEEQFRGTIPLPSFARIPSTVNSFFPAEGPQNFMADQQRLQISELHVDKFTHTFNVFMLED